MQRPIIAFSLFAGLVAFGCNGDNKAHTEQCPAGHARVGDVCQKLCSTFQDCEVGNTCGVEGYCVPTSEQPPRILRLDGDSTAEARDPTTAPHHIGGGLIIEGENLSNVVVALNANDPAHPSFDDLVVRAGATDTRIEVALPSSTEPIAYTLVVTNAAGSDQAAMTLLEGPPGPQGDAGLDGTCDPVACTSQALPGVTSTVTVQARILDPAATPPFSIVINGSELVPSTLASSEFFLAVVDRFTGELSTDAGHNVAYDISSGPMSLVGAMETVTASQLVVLVGEHNALTAVFGSVSSTPRLFDEVARFGAILGTNDLTPYNRFLLIGSLVAEPGGAVFRGSMDARVETVQVYADGTPIAGVPDHYGLLIDTAELEGGAVAQDNIQANAVSMNKIQDGAVWTNKLADNAVTNVKIDTDAVDSRTLLDASVDTADIADAAVTPAKLGLAFTTATATTASSTTPDCSTPAPHTFCALTYTAQQHTTNNGTYVYCRIIQNAGNWQVCARGNDTNAAYCEMTCF